MLIESFLDKEERKLIDEAIAKGLVQVIPMGVTSEDGSWRPMLFGKGKPNRGMKKSSVRSSVLSKASNRAVKDTGI